MDEINELKALMNKALVVLGKLEGKNKTAPKVIPEQRRRSIIKLEPVFAVNAGHGGLDLVEGYTTKGKQWTFKQSELGTLNLHKRNGDGTQTFYEGVWNRDMADLIYDKCWKKGIPTIKIHHPIRDDSRMMRVDKVNRIHRVENPIVLLAELHSNASTTHKATGFEAYTSRGETASDKYATMLYGLIEDYFQFAIRKGKSDGDPDKEKDFTMIQKTWCPAVLPEFLFYDNINDIKLIMNPKVMNTYAEIWVLVAEFAMQEYKRKHNLA